MSVGAPPSWCVSPGGRLCSVGYLHGLDEYIKKEETLENQHTLGVDHDISSSLTTAVVLTAISHESKQ